MYYLIHLNHFILLLISVTLLSLFSERGSSPLYAVARLSAMFVHPNQPVEIFGNISTPFVPWPSVGIHGKFYGDRLRGTTLYSL